jgi:hypothetical protein
VVSGPSGYTNLVISPVSGREVVRVSGFPAPGEYEIEAGTCNGSDRITVVAMQLDKLVVRDKNHPQNRKESKGRGDVPDLYVGETTNHNAEIEMIADIKPDEEEVRRRVNWEVRGRSGKPARGDFGSGSSVEVRIWEGWPWYWPFEGNNNFDFMAGCDVDGDGRFDWAETSHWVRVHLVQFEWMKVYDREDDRVSILVNERRPQGLLYVKEKEGGDTVIEIEPGIDNDTKEFRSHVLWKVEGGTAEPDSGTFEGGKIEVKLNVGGVNASREFVIKGGIDYDDNGVLDNGDEKYEVKVVVVRLGELIVWDKKIPDNFKRTKDLNTVPTLYIGENSEHNAAIQFTVTILPDTEDVRQRTIWIVEGKGASSSRGTFAKVLPVEVSLQGSNSGNRNFVVVAGFDLNADKRLGRSEKLRTLNVCLFRVQIEKCPNDWYPKGGAEDNEVTIRAYVVPSSVPGKFKFTLFAVSDEKGYCLNAPQNVPTTGEDSDSWKDLQMPPQIGFIVSGMNNDIAVSESVTLSEAMVRIKSFDYGAFGRIKAEFAPEGSNWYYVAIEEDSTNEYTTIPRDDDGNHIPDSATQNSGPGKYFAPTDDIDFDPKHQREDGDGLTRYEEWRGLIINGTHTRLDDKVKHIFICDTDGLVVPSCFETASRLGVCYILLNEMSGAGLAADGRRCVNFNRETATKGAQHALHVVNGRRHPTEDRAGNWGLVEGSILGSPVTADPRVLIWCDRIAEDARAIALDSGVTTNYLATPEGMQQLNDLINRLINLVVAHECSHGIAVSHHSPEGGGNRRCVMRYIFDEIHLFNPSAPPDPFLQRNLRPWPSILCNRGDNCFGKVDVSDN